MFALSPVFLGAQLAVLPSSGLIVEYRFDEGTGTVVKGYDSTGTNQTTLNGAFYGTAPFIPTWNAKGVVFTASIVSLPAALDLSGTGTALLVCDVAPPITSSGQSNVNPLILSRSWKDIQLAGDGRVVNGSSAIPEVSTTTKRKGPTVIALTYGATPAFWFNGTKELQYIRNSQPANGSFVQSHLGWGTSGINYNGVIYHIALWNRVLTDAEVIQATAYATNLVGARGVSFTDLIPNSANLVVAIGDSITEGFNCGLAGGEYPSIMQRALPNSRITNMGVFGATTATWTTTYIGAGKPLQAELSRVGPAKKAVLIMLGVNDVAASGSTATTLSALAAMAASARSYGATDIGITTISDATSFTAGQQTLRTNLNAGIRAGITGIDFFVDLAANASISPAVASNGVYNADGVHLVSAGDQLISNLFTPALTARGYT